MLKFVCILKDGKDNINQLYSRGKADNNVPRPVFNMDQLVRRRAFSRWIDR